MPPYPISLRRDVCAAPMLLSMGQARSSVPHVALPRGIMHPVTKVWFLPPGHFRKGKRGPGWFVFPFPLLRNSGGTIHWDLRICSWRKSRNPAPQGNFIAGNRFRVFGRFQYRRGCLHVLAAPCIPILALIFAKPCRTAALPGKGH